MNEGSAWVYLASFGASLVLTWTLMPLASRVARRLQALDRPGGYKAQQNPVPYLGGVVIVLGFTVAVLAATAIAPEGVPLDQLVVVMATGVGLSLLGLADDLRGLSPWLRLMAEVGAALVVVLSGAGVSLTEYPVINGAVTILWVVGVTNAFNLLDNMDGLSAGVAAIAAGTFVLIAGLNGQFLVGALAAALAGCAVGFLRHNFFPARIYMGDAGSLFVGFLLAVLGLKLRFDAPRLVTLFVPVVVLGVALFDTTLVVAARIGHRRNPLAGGRDHVSHRLVFLGLPVPVAVTLIYAGAVALSWLAVLMTRLDPTAALLLMGFIVAVALFFAVLLGSVPVYENSKGRRLMVREVLPHEREPLA